MLAWKDKDKSFLATRFYDLKTAPEMPDEIGEEFKRIGDEAKLKKITDIMPHNIFYDSGRNKVIILDPAEFLALDRNNRLGNPGKLN